MGGLYVAAANGEIEESELRNLASLVGEEVLREAAVRAPHDADAYREQFLAAKVNRAKLLSALELHRIFSALAVIARADGTVDQDEINALRKLARDCGVSESFVDAIM